MYFRYSVEALVNGEMVHVGAFWWEDDKMQNDIPEDGLGGKFLTILGREIKQINTPPANFYPDMYYDPAVPEFLPEKLNHWGMLFWNLKNKQPEYDGTKFYLTQIFEDDKSYEPDPDQPIY